MRRILLLNLLIIVVSGTATAQATTKTDSTKKTAVTILIGPIYSPLLHYYGRTDSLRSSALLPTIYVQFDSLHLYATATSVFISDPTQTLTYAGTITEAGYKFGSGIKGFGGNAYVNKFFYNTTQLPQSALKEQAGSNFNYMTKPVNFSGSVNLAFSDKTDVFLSLGINHIFKKKKGKNVFLVTPTFIANAGTQNFITANDVTGTVLTGSSTTPGSRFTLLDYELSVPLIYARSHFFFIATPSYIMPVNIVKVPNHPELSERGGNLFYVNLTVLYSIKIYKGKA